MANDVRSGAELGYLFGISLIIIGSIINLGGYSTRIGLAVLLIGAGVVLEAQLSR